MNKILPLVSIVVPIYNSESFLQECLNSIKNQTYKNIEVLLIDDGSNDSSGSICDDFVLDNKNAKVYHNDNMGVSVSRNYGINHSRGKYIYFCDSDDILCERIIEKFVNNINKTNSDLVSCGYTKFKIASTIQFCTDSSYLIFNSNLKTIQLFNNSKCTGYLWNKLFDTRIIKENNIEFDTDLEVLEDMLFCLRYIVYCRSICILDKAILYAYRDCNESSITHSIDKNGLSFPVIEGQERIYVFLKENCDDDSILKWVWNKLMLEILDCYKHILLKKDSEKIQKKHILIEKYRLYEGLYKIDNMNFTIFIIMLFINKGF